MELKTLTKEEIMEIDSRLHFKRTKLCKLVDTFADSNEEVMEVKFEVGEYSKPDSCATSLRSYLKKTKRDMWINVKNIKGHVYIYKTDDRPLEDEVRNCVSCGNDFLLEANTIKWCLSKNLTPFVRCEDCRKKRRENKEDSNEY